MNLTHSNYASIILFITSACFLPIALASNPAQVTKPNKCPGIAALQSIHIQKSDLIEIEHERWDCCTADGHRYHVDGKWAVREYISHYDTNDQWALSLHDVIANNAEEALQETNKGLSTLTFAYGPSNYMGHWSCGYYSAVGDAAAWYLG